MKGTLKKIFNKKEILTIPNLISLIRICLVPLIVFLYFKFDNHMACALCVAFSGLTDMLDGFIARRFKMDSNFGKVFDAVADKLTEAVLFVILFEKYTWIICAIVLLYIKECMMIWFGFIAFSVTDEINGAKWYGKVSTTVIYVSMIILIYFNGIKAGVAYSLIAICCFCLLGSLILYLRFFVKNVKTNTAEEVSFSLTKFFFVLVWGAIIIISLFLIKDFSIDDILTITRNNMQVAVLIMLLLFAIKSLTFVIHIDLLYIACGLLFDPALAITVDVLGTLITFIIPYVIGRIQSHKLVNKLIHAFPKVEKMAKKREENDFIFSLAVRAAGGIPYDVVSFLMGALGVNFINYLISGLIAISPDIILSQIAGSYLDDISSPAFIISVSIKVVKVVVSVIILRIIAKHKSKKANDVSQSAEQTLQGEQIAEQPQKDVNE